jgi:TetR/AcrR family fatty acid metabolism transcriptional regulator
MLIHLSTVWRTTINTKEKKNDKYDRILDAAVKIFADQDFFQSTISQIAREAGVADGTIYLYFKNKDDILIQFFRHKTKQVFERFREAVDQGNDAIEKLRNLLQSHLAEFQSDRNLAVVYQTETHRINRLAEEPIKEMSKMYLDLVTEIIEQGQEEGSVRKDLYSWLVKRFIIGAVDEVINTWLHSKTSYDLVSMTDPLMALFVRGIGPGENSQSDK